jgi:glucose-6-phosphate isomerase
MRLTELAAYPTLVQHQKEIAPQRMRDWFVTESDRFERYSLQVNGILLDYSRNRINDTTLQLLLELAEQSDLKNRMIAMFKGDPINTSEQRAVLHTALRGNAVVTTSIRDMVASSKIKMQEIVEKVRSGKWVGVSGKPITHIVNIGIGGSHLGPKMALNALQDIAIKDIQCHFISSIDSAHVQDVLSLIDPTSTLFILSSKSFSTLETLTNANSILDWVTPTHREGILQEQFIAVTAQPSKAEALGIPTEHIIPFGEWVGGRYSVWSSVGLPLAIMLGYDRFTEFLAGAHAMDEHFRTAPFSQNMPVLLALLGIWYINFFDSPAHAIIPYADRLRYLIPYLQQADMESNGKSVDLNGHPISYRTGPIIFGEEGINGQHAYHQALHQGQLLIPADFILVASPTVSHHHSQHAITLASCLSQATALMQGKTANEALNDLLLAGLSQTDATNLAPHQVIAGNKPSNIIVLPRLSPDYLGALLALYEHKIFVQGVIWHINSFDQWGVELGKALLPTIHKQLQASNHSEQTIDSATAALANYLKGMSS